jgi:hypothetical protein
VTSLSGKAYDLTPDQFHALQASGQPSFDAWINDLNTKAADAAVVAQAEAAALDSLSAANLQSAADYGAANPYTGPVMPNRSGIYASESIGAPSSLLARVPPTDEGLLDILTRLWVEEDGYMVTPFTGCWEQLGAQDSYSLNLASADVGTGTLTFAPDDMGTGTRILSNPSLPDFESGMYAKLRPLAPTDLSVVQFWESQTFQDYTPAGIQDEASGITFEALPGNGWSAIDASLYGGALGIGVFAVGGANVISQQNSLTSTWGSFTNILKYMGDSILQQSPGYQGVSDLITFATTGSLPPPPTWASASAPSRISVSNQDFGIVSTGEALASNPTVTWDWSPLSILTGTKIPQLAPTGAFMGGSAAGIDPIAFGGSADSNNIFWNPGKAPSGMSNISLWEPDNPKPLQEYINAGLFVAQGGQPTNTVQNINVSGTASVVDDSGPFNYGGVPSDWAFTQPSTTYQDSPSGSGLLGQSGGTPYDAGVVDLPMSSQIDPSLYPTITTSDSTALPPPTLNQAAVVAAGTASLAAQAASQATAQATAQAAYDASVNVQMQGYQDEHDTEYAATQTFLRGGGSVDWGLDPTVPLHGSAPLNEALDYPTMFWHQ